MAATYPSFGILPARKSSRALALLALGIVLIFLHQFTTYIYPHQKSAPVQQSQEQQRPLESQLNYHPIFSDAAPQQDEGGFLSWNDPRLPKMTYLNRFLGYNDPVDTSLHDQEPQPEDPVAAPAAVVPPSLSLLQEQPQNEAASVDSPDVGTQIWKIKAEALQRQLQELEAKLKHGDHEHHEHEHTMAEKSRPYRIRLEDDPVGLETDTIPEELLRGKTTGARRGNVFRNIEATRQHGGTKLEVNYMQSNRQLKVPSWDKNKPLPAWWVETQKFIKEMETRPGMEPMPNKYVLLDVCIWLGYNNIRYILEMGTLFSGLINRTMVLPEYVFMRACDEMDLCRQYGTLQDLSYHPDRKFPRWTFPTNQVWDFDEIRKRHNVITASEFVKIQLVQQGIVVDDPKEWLESRGGEYGYAQPTNLAMAFLDMNSSLTMESHDFLDEWYPWGSNNINLDDLDPLPDHGQPQSRVLAAQVMQSQIAGKDEGEAGNANKATEVIVPPRKTMHAWTFGFRPDMSLNLTLDQEFQIRWLEDYGVPGYNPQGYGGIPVGFKQRYGPLQSDYLHWIEGIHRFAVPPCWFSTQAARDRYAHIVLHELKLHGDLRAARDMLLAKLYARINGGSSSSSSTGSSGEGAVTSRRTYQAVHLRQGDMRDMGWFPDADNAEMARNVAFSLWRHRLRRSASDAGGSNGGSDMNEKDIDYQGRDGLPRPSVCDSDVRRTTKGEVLWALNGTSRVAEEGEERPATWDEMMVCLDRQFYFATDSNDPTMVDAMREYGGFHLDDLIDTEFLNKHMKVAAFGDLKGIMDQWMMANARHFLGSYMSSLTGGALNQRLEIGKAANSSSFLNFHRKWMQTVDDLYYQNKLSSLSTAEERTAWISEYEQRKLKRASARDTMSQGAQGDNMF